MKAVVAAIITATIVAPAAFAIGTAHDPRVPALERRVSALQSKVAAIASTANDLSASMNDAQAALTQAHNCLFWLGLAWNQLSIYQSPAYGQLELNKRPLSPDCPT